MGTKNLVNLKKYAFINLNILSKKGGEGGGAGVWHENESELDAGVYILHPNHSYATPPFFWKVI